jgi:hypothetical protein
MPVLHYGYALISIDQPQVRAAAALVANFTLEQLGWQFRSFV